MTTTEEYRAELRGLPTDRIAGYLSARSGLPGPRSNLALLEAFGDVADTELVLRAAEDPDEYLRSCGTAAAGRLLAEAPAQERPSLVELLHRRAADPLWRVREAVAMALQRLGDADRARLRELVALWAGDPHPLVSRAAVAGICEPRLLDGDTARAALAACARATGVLTAVPTGAARRDPEVRTLRQGLGYCWSVAVAALPAEGLPAFARLAETDDPDVAWIVRENRKKARLRTLLPAED